MTNFTKYLFLTLGLLFSIGAQAEPYEGATKFIWPLQGDYGYDKSTGELMVCGQSSFVQSTQKCSNPLDIALKLSELLKHVAMSYGIKKKMSLVGYDFHWTGDASGNMSRIILIAKPARDYK